MLPLFMLLMCQSCPRRSLTHSISTVVFHCNSCKAGGRGQRSAAWYQDWLDSEGISSSKALVLAGGWQAWAAAFPDKVVKV